MNKAYGNFFGMIATSMVVMYVVNYFTTYELSHVHWSSTRFFMLLVMGGAMAVVMLSFMRKMYLNRKLNLLIYSGSFLLAAIGLYLTRSQVTIGDKAWMKAMIPHHSIAILTSERAGLEDVRVKELSEKIIRAQRREIREMTWLLEDIDRNGFVTSPDLLNGREVPEFEGSP